MFTGEKSQHCFKSFVGQFSHGLTCLAEPFKGKTHDGEMLSQSGWTHILAREAAAGRHFIIFGDAGFAISQFVQSMYRDFSGFILRESRTVNKYMLRIRIYIENYFAGVSNIFSYLSFNFQECSQARCSQCGEAVRGSKLLHECADYVPRQSVYCCPWPSVPHLSRGVPRYG